MTIGKISIFKNSAVNNGPQHGVPGNKPHKHCSLCTEVYCLQLNFKISKLAYSVSLVTGDGAVEMCTLSLI